MIYRLSSKAIDDLDRLYTYGVLKFGLSDADAFYDGLLQHFDNLAENPRLYARCDDFEGYRRSVYKSQSVYYKIEDDGVFIVRILGQQDAGNALS